jgi:hypothetical protein
MWILLLLAVNINNPQDVPGKVSIEFPTEQACQQAQATVISWLKFDTFKVTTQCVRKSSLSQTTPEIK